MDKILLVFTGGTIGSKTGNGVIDVDGGAGGRLVAAFRRLARDEVEFDAVQPLNILSENLVPAHWETLSNALAEKDLSEYKGVIITHGTDTLPYTAAVFSYLLRGIALPVVFVAGNRGVGLPGSNSAENFTAAVQFILNEGLPGVYSVFRDKNGKMPVYLGTRLLESGREDDQYRSYKGVDFGEMRAGRFVYNENPLNPAPETIKSSARGFAAERQTFGNGVFFILPYPGLDYSIFNFGEKKPAAVLHGLYHSSTACVEPRDNSLVEFAEMCEKLGIDLYLFDCRHCADGSVYLSSAKFMRERVFMLTDIPHEAALAKLYVAYNQTALPPPEYMRQNIFYEYAKEV